MTTDPYGDAGPATFGPGGQAPVAPGYGIGDPALTTTVDTTTVGTTAVDTRATGTGSGESSTKDTAKAEAGQVKDTAAGAAQQVAGTAKDEASNVIGEAKAQASNLLDQVRGEAGSQAGTQKDRLAGLAHSYAKELGAMASSSEESGPVTDLVHDLSRRVGGAGHWLENHEPADVLDEVRRFARRRPGAFLLTALAAGVVVGRLTRGAVDEHRATSDSDTATTPELTTVAAPVQTGYTGYADAPVGYPDGPATGLVDDPYSSQGATYGTNPGDVR